MDADKSTLEQSVDALAKQIYLAMVTTRNHSLEEDLVGDDTAEPDFTVKELRDELYRLKVDQDSNPSHQGGATNEIMATVPAVVPDLPAGILVSASMEGLLQQVTVGVSNRVGFFGMVCQRPIASLTSSVLNCMGRYLSYQGGIGKTVVASWLVRHDSVREAFDKIIWVTLGQTPNAANVQNIALKQLTNGGKFDGESAEERKLVLQQAMQNKKLLLVLDDCWEAPHERLLNMIDEGSGSKVLLSSRVRQVLEGSGTKDTHAEKTSIVDIELPSASDAVKMLLYAASLSAEGVVEAPQQAHELVQFCKMLPLSISIVGKLVKEFGLVLDNPDDWQDIVSVIKVEFAESDGQRTVEEAVIAASVNSISGTQKKNVMHLFKSLALLPEDTAVPLEIVSLMFQAVPGDDGATMKKPNLLNIRRWLKKLLDRSLVLGSVDRPTLHDIVGAFINAQHSEDGLQQAHRTMVELLRAARPTDAASGTLEWTNAGDTPTSRYVRYQCA